MPYHTMPYQVRRSWKHFERILSFLRDGACALPGAYEPRTMDNRRASSEEEELLEFVREASALCTLHARARAQG